MLQKAKGNNKELFLRVTENVLKGKWKRQEGWPGIMSRRAPSREGERGRGTPETQQERRQREFNDEEEEEEEEAA